MHWCVYITANGHVWSVFEKKNRAEKVHATSRLVANLGDSRSFVFSALLFKFDQKFSLRVEHSDVYWKHSLYRYYLRSDNGNTRDTSSGLKDVFHNYNIT